MVIIAAPAFLFHPTLATFLISFAVKFNACFFSHTVMHLQGDSRRNAEVQNGKKCYGELFHALQM